MKKNSEKTDDTDGVKKDDEDQSKQFIEAAKEIDADPKGKFFKKAVDSIGKPKH